jgi:hypothetical protein
MIEVVKIKLSLSKIARDPAVASFLERGERDVGPEPAVAWLPRAPVLADAQAVKVLEVA